MNTTLAATTRQFVTTMVAIVVRTRVILLFVGSDGYACRDPSTTMCDVALTDQCEHDGNNKKASDPTPLECRPDEQKYRLQMFDSFDAGWGTTVLTITPTENPDKIIFKDGLVNGAQGIAYICLSGNEEPSTCYDVNVSGGTWGNQVSWEIRPLAEGAKALADGGTPMSCSFPVAGQDCERTCRGKYNVDPKDDEHYTTYKDLYSCMQWKCLIQVATCNLDINCPACFAEDTPDFCFANNDKFNALIDCTLCNCVDTFDDFCSKKPARGVIIPDIVPDEPPSRNPCTPWETLSGAGAMLTFSSRQYTNVDSIGRLVIDFDNNNFAALDYFEACVYSFRNDRGHGGFTALSCMQMLVDAAMNNKDGGEAALASLLYNKNAQDFCEYASSASADCPLCPSFLRFKTLLYESLDTCNALNEIECDAWAEFYPTCKRNLENKFILVDFTKQEQCKSILKFLLVTCFV